MKTILVAAAAWIIGAVLGYALARRYISTLRRKVRELRAALNGKAPRKKMGTMDRVLVLEAVVLVAYTVADLVVFWHTGSEPTTLTACVFGVCGMENGVMGWIKTNKDKMEQPGGGGQRGGPEPEQAEPPDVGQ